MIPINVDSSDKETELFATKLDATKAVNSTRLSPVTSRASTAVGFSSGRRRPVMGNFASLKILANIFFAAVERITSNGGGDPGPRRGARAIDGNYRFITQSLRKNYREFTQ